ncbi:MAG: hypothetical protein HQL28_05180, partial [Candidatus Omnitrophica bacterium]|nr:hypothetical protein [Candidatus Omnitrophota bacterium]
LKLWSLNPVILYGIYMMGGVDIIPAALAMLALLLMKERKIWPAFILLSAAALFKTFSLFMLLPLLVFITRGKKDLLVNLTAMAIPFAVVLLPFFFSSGYEVLGSIIPPSASGNSGALGMILPMVEKLVFVGLYLALLFGSFKLRNSSDDKAILRISIASILLLYTLLFTPVHYFVWVIPMLIAAVCLKMISMRLYMVQILCLFIFNLNSSATSFGLFMPIDPHFFSGIPGLPDIIHGFSIKWGIIMLMARMAFMAICVIMAMNVMGLSGFRPKFGTSNEHN